MYRVILWGSGEWVSMCIRDDFPFGLPGGAGDGLRDAMAFTAGRLVNSISPVVTARPGHLTPNDLPQVGPRHGMAATLIGSAS